jgi:hypothetical protein
VPRVPVHGRAHIWMQFYGAGKSSSCTYSAVDCLCRMLHWVVVRSSEVLSRWPNAAELLSVPVIVYAPADGCCILAGLHIPRLSHALLLPVWQAVSQQRPFQLLQPRHRCCPALHPSLSSDFHAAVTTKAAHWLPWPLEHGVPSFLHAV